MAIPAYLQLATRAYGAVGPLSGPVSSLRGGGTISAGAGASAVTEFTNLNDSGAGSIRAAIGAGKVLRPASGLNGTLTLATDLLMEFDDWRLDCRGRAITVDGAGGNKLDIENGTDWAILNVLVTKAGIGGADQLLSPGRSGGTAAVHGPGLLSNIEFYLAGDDMLTNHLYGDSSGGSDFTWFEPCHRPNDASPYTAIAEKMGTHFSNVNSVDVNLVRIAAIYAVGWNIWQRCYRINTKGQGQAEFWELMSYVAWSQFAGAAFDGDVSGWVENCTLDAQFAGMNDEDDGIHVDDPAAQFASAGLRLIGGATVGWADQGTAIDWRDRFSLTLEAASAALDTVLLERSGNSLQIEADTTSTVDGVDEDVVAGKTAAFKTPTNAANLSNPLTDPEKDAFLADLKFVAKGSRTVQATGSDVASASDVTRDGNNALSVVFASNPSLTDDCELYYEGSSLPQVRPDLTLDDLSTQTRESRSFPPFTVNAVSPAQASAPINYPGAASRLRMRI